MTEITPSKFTRIWQTAAALPVALVTCFLGVLLGGVFLTIFSGASLIPEKGISQVWYLSAAAWIGVYAAHQTCEFLFSYYARRLIFVMFAILAIANFALEYQGDGVLWDQISRFFQGLVMVLTAYAFFCYRESSTSSN